MVSLPLAVRQLFDVVGLSSGKLVTKSIITVTKWPVTSLWSQMWPWLKRDMPITAATGHLSLTVSSGPRESLWTRLFALPFLCCGSLALERKFRINFLSPCTTVEEAAATSEGHHRAALRMLSHSRGSYCSYSHEHTWESNENCEPRPRLEKGHEHKTLPWGILNPGGFHVKSPFVEAVSRCFVILEGSRACRRVLLIFSVLNGSDTFADRSWVQIGTFLLSAPA